MVFAFLSGCSNAPLKKQSEEVNTYIKSVWITYYELTDLTDNKNQVQFEKEVEKIINKLSELGFNSVTLQVRPFCDAFYNSNIFPQSSCFKGCEKYDVLKIFCDVCNKYNFNIEAWINPYRVSNSKKTKIENIKLKGLSNVDIIKVGNGTYLNPSSKNVQSLVFDGVKEIVTNYDIYAIQFDDYFYPENINNEDSKQYNRYLKNTGNLTLEDWRRNNVTELIIRISEFLKSNEKHVKFGISPSSNIETNFNKLYADVGLWIKNKYIDYVCPQIYFGFKNDYQPFMFTVKKWIEFTEGSNVKLYVGLPLYKAGKVDKYASLNNEKQKEFVQNQNIIRRQIEYLSKLENIKGYYIFSYSSFNDEISKNEVSNMASLMQDSNHF